MSKSANTGKTEYVSLGGTVTSYSDEPEVAWAAGYIDGEGCISVSRNGKGNEQYLLRLTVSSTFLRSLSKLQRLFGGTIYGPRSRQSCRPSWVWSAGIRETQAALSQMLPYLTVKESQARVALAFPWFGARGGGKKIAPALLEHRQAVAEELRRLKGLTLNKEGGKLETP